MAHAIGWCPLREFRHCIADRMSVASLFIGDFCVGTARLGRFDLRLGTGSRKLLVHALCVTAMFGYDVAQRRLMGREVLAVSFQDAGCSLFSGCWVRSLFRMLGA